MFKLILKIFRLHKSVKQLSDVLYKKINKLEKNQERIEVMIALLKKDSHPPIFKKDTYDIINTRLDEHDEKHEIIDSFFEGIEKIVDENEKKVAN